MAASWDLRRLQQYLDKYPPAELYFLYGEEIFLMDESLDLIREKTLTSGATDFNRDVFYAPNNSAAQVRDAVETLPVMCEKRLVVYKGVQSLNEKEWEQLYPILENPIESTTLVLIAEKLDKRKRFFKKLQKKGTIVELKRPYENQLQMWIEYIAYKLEVTLDQEAMALVQQLVGNNLIEVRNELDKLKNFLGDEATSRKITAKDVLKVVSHTKIDSIFDLTNAIGRKDRAAALTMLANLLDHGENEIAVLSLITRHIRILSELKDGMKCGLNGAKLSAKAGIPNFFLKQYQDQCRAWDNGKLRKTIEALHKTDRALKSSPVSSHIWLESFIVQSCG